MTGVFKSCKSILLFILIIGDSSYSKKNFMKNIKTSESKNINECQRCKVLTDSVNHWLKLTSRGKHEGGDAAWEESKLKNYARSEMRLVEIQEGLCSEVKRHQDSCYALAEETEQVLEKWWFHESTNSIDLYTWLCIETLQNCCPKEKYGVDCISCPIYKNKVCAGHGKCDGEGTREGNGTCVCNYSYSGEKCHECGVNFYIYNTDLCKPCHTACSGCSGNTTSDCTTCATGWQLVQGQCVDINECLDTFVCNKHQFCVNLEGYHKCEPCDASCVSCDGAGPSNCTLCEPGSELWTGSCINKAVKSELKLSFFKRIALYCGLIIMTFFIHRNKRFLASLVVLIVAVFIYYSEKMSQMTVINIFSNAFR